VPGACLVRNDVVRKALAGVSPLTRLGPEHYTAEVSARVYSTVAERAALALRAGHTVVVDGVFARASDREAIARVAADCGVPFAGIWLDAPAETLLARARARQRDASDADEAVVRAQLSQAIGSQAWHRVDASGTPESALREALALLARVRPESLREDDGDTSRALKVD
jgi:predicted kinase